MTPINTATFLTLMLLVSRGLTQNSSSDTNTTPTTPAEDHRFTAASSAPDTEGNTLYTESVCQGTDCHTHVHTPTTQAVTPSTHETTLSISKSVVTSEKSSAMENSTIESQPSTPESSTTTEQSPTSKQSSAPAPESSTATEQSSNETKQSTTPAPDSSTTSEQTPISTKQSATPKPEDKTATTSSESSSSPRSTSNPTSDPTPSSNGTTNSCTYLGCYDDDGGARTLTFFQKQLDASSMTRETCVSACQEGGYAFAGLEYGKQCFCGPRIVPPHAELPANGTVTHSEMRIDCSYACTGDESETCGGFAAMDVFQCASNDDGEGEK